MYVTHSLQQRNLIAEIKDSLLINRIKKGRNQNHPLLTNRVQSNGNQSISLLINASIISRAVTGGTLIRESSLFAHPPSHLHKPVRPTAPLQHSQFSVHDLAHPHYRRMEEPLLLSSRVVQKDNNAPLLFLRHPQS